MGLLSGLRVVEASASGAAAFAGAHLAAWGADVVVIEPPGGSPLRRAAPAFQVRGQQMSARWTLLSRGKRIAEVGSSSLPRPGDALALAREADIVLAESEVCIHVFGMTPQGLEEALGAKPVGVLITPFSLQGPYAAYRATDLGINALGGWCNIIGDPGSTPLRPGYDMIYRLQGVCALVAALASLRTRDVRSGPAFAHVNGQALAASMIVAPWLMKRMLGVEQVRRANDWLQGGVMKCSDGWAGCTPLTATHWELMCRMMGLDDILDLPSGLDPTWRWEHSEQLLERAQPFLGSASRFEVFHLAQAWRIPAAPVEDVAERLECPHLAARGFWEMIELDGKTVQVPRIPYRIEGEPPATLTPAHAVSRGPLAWTENGSAAPVEGPRRNPGSLPLAGVRVLDLTHFWAGPYATSLMAALGADVIKVESVQRPDAFRFTFAPSQLDQWWERSPAWQDANCGKRGITLDLSSPRGAALFARLCQTADVVVNNFSNRVMANFGLESDRLRELNPRLIDISLPGYGPGGPWEDYVGFGIAFEQLAVCASITGYEDGVPRIMSGFCDPLSGLHAVAALLLALRRRDRTGQGATIEAPQCETLDSLFGPEHIAVQMGSPVPRMRGNKHEWMAPHHCYRVAGEDRWISIAVGADEEFGALCAVLGLPLATDARFASAAARKANEQRLDELVGAATISRDGEALERDLQAVGVMACRVAKGWELPADADLAAWGFFQDVSRGLTGRHPYKTWPFRLSGIDMAHRRPAPLLGEHNEEILCGELGLTTDELSMLTNQNVIGTRPLGI